MVSRRLCCVVLTTTFVVQVTCLTNAEFYDRLKAFIKDEDYSDEEYDPQTIELPGGPDDELDVGYLMEGLGFALTTSDTQTMEKDYVEDMDKADIDDSEMDVDGMTAVFSNELKERPHNLGWWIRTWPKPKDQRLRYQNRHHLLEQQQPNRRRNKKRWCQCYRWRCACCLQRTLQVGGFFPTSKFYLNVCVNVNSRGPRSYNVRFSLNGNQLLNESTCLNSRRLYKCFEVDGLKNSSLCIDVYNVSHSQRSMCALVEGSTIVGNCKRTGRQQLGCFRITANPHTPSDIVADSEQPDDIDDVTTNQDDVSPIQHDAYYDA